MSRYILIENFIESNVVNQPTSYNTGENNGIYFEASRQLFAKDMALEVQNPKTPVRGRAAILKAFKAGYNTMIEMDVAADRILFVEYTNENIAVWMD